MWDRRVGPGSASQRVPQHRLRYPNAAKSTGETDSEEASDIDGRRWTMTFLSETSANSMVLQLSINIFHEYYPISSMMDGS